ncbi:MAG: protein-tyrosine phosphatase family protein [Candidatus Endonucleobacter sp. (ex Gigantidas childressi)]|nr:protein-tyrosine phosphatase family protein [Candidatus Endonucleobacter sp. (ex Gigantidas childressi)]
MTGKINQPSISTLQTKFENFQAKEKSGRLKKLGKTVKKFVQKKSYQTLKMQLSSMISSHKSVSNEVKKDLMQRKGEVVSAKSIIRGLQSINDPQKSAEKPPVREAAKPPAREAAREAAKPPTRAAAKPPAREAAKPPTRAAAKPPTRDAALSLPEKGDKARNNFKAKMESSQLSADLVSANIFKKGDQKDDALQGRFDNLSGAQTLDQNARAEGAGMFRRYGNFHKANMDSAVTFKSASFPHQLHANKVELLGQNFICHEAVEIPGGGSNKPNAKTGLGSLLAMYSEQDISVSINLTAPLDNGRAKGFGIGSYVEAEGLKVGDEREMPDIAGESHTLKVLDIRRHDPNDGGLNVDMVKVSIDGKEHTHLYCKEWNDFGVISTEKMLELSHLHHEVKADASGPTAVHCSAGLGRTGAFIAVDAVINSDSASTDGLSSDNLVEDIRSQRFAAVQTSAQFKIIDTVVNNKDALQKLMHSNNEAGTNVGETTKGGSPKIVSENEPVYANVSSQRAKAGPEEAVYDNLGSFSLSAVEVKSQLKDGTYANLKNGKPANMNQWLNDIGKLSSDDLSALFTKKPPSAIMRALWSDPGSGVMKMHAEKKVATFFSAAAKQGMTSPEAQRNYANTMVANHPLAEHLNGFWLQFAKDEIKNS